MPRISLVEQYDNKDVIQQIYKLKGDVSQAVDTVNAVEGQLNEAEANASEALNKANEALGIAQGFSQDIEDLQTGLQETEGNVDELQTESDGSVKFGSIVTTATTAVLRLVKNNNSQEDSNVPLASGSAAGMMTAQTYNGLVQLQDRVAALEAAQNVYYVVFANTTPTQGEITTAFTSVAGRAPTAGDYATDIAKGLTYGYDGTTWIKVESGQVPAFTNESAGLIKGSQDDGQVFAEADGTGSVNGWDTLKGYVGTPQDAASSSGSLYARVAELVSDVTANTADIAMKQDDLSPVVVALTVEGWVDNQQTQACANVTADNIVWVSPVPASFDAYAEAGIRAIAQGAGTITFQCTTVPTVEIQVQVVA